MQIPDDYQPEFDSLLDLMLQIGREQSAQKIPHMLTRTFALRPHVALARIWLVKPGDRCNTCHRNHTCRHSDCLHMESSHSRFGQNLDWNTIEGPDARIPLGVSRIGEVAATGKGLRIYDIDNKNKSLLSQEMYGRDPEIVGLGIQPLALQNDIIGVIAVYTVMDLTRVRRGDLWLRTAASFGASGIVNTRSFEQISSLKARLELENHYLREKITQIQSFGDIVGISPPILAMLDQIKQVAPTDASVLILGESGTGKELVARETHKLSKRKNNPMISVNCASIPKELFESEFFGHKKGAFTGASSDRGGRFQAAGGGTLFLDEVGEIPLPMQGTLLRVLQEGRYERLGEEITRRADVRIIAATNKDLEKGVQQGTFRQDLFYRLNVFPIKVAPLRERKKDIPLLARHFLKSMAEKMNLPRPHLSEANIQELMAYDWPGNVRELQNWIERSLIAHGPGKLCFHLPPSKQVKGSRTEEPEYKSKSSLEAERGVLTEKEMTAKIRENMILALTQCHRKIYGPDGAAALLGITPTTLSSRISRMGIKKQDLCNE